MKLVIFLNPSAGTKSNDYSPENITEVFRNLNIEAEILSIEKKLSAETILSLKSNGINVVAAAGGDGTISSVASYLVGKDIQLGVIPLGTLNHFAKDLYIPLQLEEAAKVIAEGKTIDVDTGEVNGKIFINNSSIGLYPKMVKHRDKEIETLGNKWLSMFKAFIKIFIRMPVMSVKIISDENHIHCRTPFVFIGNNEYEMDLFNLGSRSDITGGTLSLYYPVVSGRLSMLRFFFLALMNKLNTQKDFNAELVTGLTIESRKKIIDVSLDGEVLHMEAPLNYTIHPRSLKVIVPA